MKATDRLTPPERVARAAVLVAAGLATTGIWRGTYDPFQAPKALVLWLSAAVVLGALAWQAVATRRVPQLPRASWVLAAVPVAFVASLLVTDSILGSVFGQPFRHAGVIGYASLAVLAAAIVALSQKDDRLPRHVVVLMLVGAIANALYGVLQVTGLDAFTWTSKPDELVGLVGNTNYAGAVIAAGVGPLTALVLARRVDVRWRVAAGLAVVLLAATAVATGTLQGPFLLVVAPVVPIVAWLRVRDDAWRERGPRAVVGVAATAGLLVTLGVASIGPLGALGSVDNVESRKEVWSSTRDMVADGPLLGVGADRFADHHRTYRLASEAESLDPLEAPTAPHSVPLEMLANVGLVGLVAHLAMVVVVALVLWRGLLSTEDDRRRSWLAAAGSLWLTYQVQSLISIDVVPLAALHWLSAGAILAMVATGPARSREPLGEVRPGWTVGLVGGMAGLLSVLLLVAVFLQGSAQTRMRHGISQVAQGDPAAALATYEVAAGRATWWYEPMLRAGDAARQVGDLALAERHLVEAEARAPGFASPLVALIDLHAQAGDWDKARAASDRLLDLDPKMPASWSGRARLELAVGDLDAALHHAREAHARGGRTDAVMVLADVLVARGEVDEARSILEAGIERTRSDDARERMRKALAELPEQD